MESEALKRYKEKEARRVEINLKHLEQGVEFVDLYAAYIEESVEIGAGTVIGPCVTLKGNTSIGENCVITHGSLIENCVIGNDTVINASQCYNSKIGSEVKIGPFSHIRPVPRQKDRADIILSGVSPRISEAFSTEKFPISENSKRRSFNMTILLTSTVVGRGHDPADQVV